MKYFSTRGNSEALNFIDVLTSGTAKAQLGQESRVATTAAPFLTLGVGAKGTSLGHANAV